MSVILSLQGCMAVGKTTALKYVQDRRKDIFISYENPRDMLNFVREMGWDKDTLDGFVEIQRLFITNEIRRWEELRTHDYVLIDLGADEIEFFTLYYPKTMGYDWDIERELEKELDELRQCEYSGILFLTASKEVIYRNHQTRNNGPPRKGTFFDHYVLNMYPEKVKWFLSTRKDLTTFVDVSNMTIEQVGESVINWLDSFIC